ncbi:hypothetical protein [Nostoc parmelioides]|nr:hypothetical protein [Nostoc parmelioides]
MKKLIYENIDFWLKGRHLSNSSSLKTPDINVRVSVAVRSPVAIRIISY